MDYSSAISLAIGLIAGAVFAQGTADTLAKARDKMLSSVPAGPQYTCVETIDRNYFSRKNSPFRQPS